MGKVVWKKNVVKRINEQSQRGLINAANKIYNQSQKWAPFDDGELTLGARISSEGEGTDKLEVVISYGNNAVSAQYAVLQHENLLYNHTAPEQAKFLESAFIKYAPKVPDIVAKTIKIK